MDLEGIRVSKEKSDVHIPMLSRQGFAGGPAVTRDTAAASQGSETAPEADAPDDCLTQGLLDTVDPSDTDEILRLRGLVDTRLHRAARAQDVEALCELLAAGAAPAALDWEGRTPLHLCVQHRLIEPLKVLLSVPGSADVRDASGWPLLHVALLHGWRDGARAILDAGARVAPKCVHSTLWKAPRKRRLLRSPRQTKLKRYPTISDPEFRNSFYKLPIEIVMESDDMEMLETILTFAERDGVVDSLNAYGRTPLRTAIQRGNLPAIQALLRKGASPHRVSHLGESALHIAVYDSNILKYLLDNTDVSSTLDDKGLAPIHKAVCAKNPESVRLLLDRFNNALVKTDPDENTPLHYAAFKACNEAAEIILQKSEQAMNEVNKQGDTPLHLAVKCNNKGLAARLLQKGAVLSSKDINGVTVLELISTHFYDASNFYDQIFDSYICKKNMKSDDDDFRIEVLYKVLTKTNDRDTSQLQVVEKFVECGRSKALLHPLIESLLDLKWNYYLSLFYTMSGIYAVFLASFNIFLIKLFHHNDMNNRSSSVNSSVLNTSSNSDEASGFHGGVYWPLIVLIYISILMLLLQVRFPSLKTILLRLPQNI